MKLFTTSPYFKILLVCFGYFFQCQILLYFQKVWTRNISSISWFLFWAAVVSKMDIFQPFTVSQMSILLFQINIPFSDEAIGTEDWPVQISRFVSQLRAGCPQEAFRFYQPFKLYNLKHTHSQTSVWNQISPWVVHLTPSWLVHPTTMSGASHHEWCTTPPLVMHFTTMSGAPHHHEWCTPQPSVVYLTSSWVVHSTLHSTPLWCHCACSHKQVKYVKIVHLCTLVLIFVGTHIQRSHTTQLYETLKGIEFCHVMHPWMQSDDTQKRMATPLSAATPHVLIVCVSELHFKSLKTRLSFHSWWHETFLLLHQSGRNKRCDAALFVCSTLPLGMVIRSVQRSWFIDNWECTLLDSQRMSWETKL